MKASYINALEMQAKWLRWGKEKNREGDYPAYHMYVHTLECAATTYMNKNFCALVDHARLTVPDELEFEENWMITPVGWMWLETPFTVPTPISDEPFPEGVKHSISAIGWMKVPEGWYFMCYHDHAEYAKELEGFPRRTSFLEGFSCWSNFIIRPGDKMIDRLRSFEAAQRRLSDGGSYLSGRETELLHEMRWVYSALHLMSQRLTHISEHKPSGMARYDARRKRLVLAPMLKVISLRRMEQERPKGDGHQDRDWQWQWLVQGHWRLQPYKTLGDYKWIFIESYIKGPEDKPLKPPQHIIYKAQR